MKDQTTQLVKALLKNNDNPNLAWLLFKRALSSPSPPLPDLCLRSVPVVARLLARAQMLPELDDLRRLVATASETPETTHQSLLSLVRALSDSGLSEKAVSHFKSVRSQFPERVHSVQLYNSLLESSLRRRDFDSLSWLYEDMVGSGVGPETYTCNLLIGALCESGNLEDAREVFDKMRLKGCSPNEFTVGILVRGYCKSGLSERALEFLDEKMTGVLPNRVVYNTLISCLCREGKTDEAEKLVEKMNAVDILPNIVTFNSRISALCKSGKILEASRIFRDMDADKELGLPRPNTITYNTMLDGFCREGMLEEARMLFDSMKTKNGLIKLQTYNIYLMALFKNSKFFEAQSLLKDMVENGLNPSTYTYNIIINGLCKNGLLSDAKMVMGLMKSSGVSADTITYTSLLHGYCNKGRVFEANKVLQEMTANNCRPNTLTCNILLRSLWKKGNISEAEELLIKMSERGFGIDTVTCNIVIDALCENGKLDKAIEIANEMWDRGSEALDCLGGVFVGLFDGGETRNNCRPDLITYTTVIVALCKAGKINEAKKKLVEMIGKKLSPDTFIYNTFIHSYCKEGKVSLAFRVLKDMEKKGCNKNLQTYNSLILGLGIKNQIFEIDGLVDEMRERGISPDVFTYNNMMRCLCEIDRIRDALSLLDEMLEKGTPPNIASFKILIAALSKAHEFGDSEQVFQIGLTVCGHREPLYSLLFNELFSGDEFVKAKMLFKEALDKNVYVGNFQYKNFIEKLCEVDDLEEAHGIINHMVEKGHGFDTSSFFPVIDGLRKKGNKREADLLTDKMMEMQSKAHPHEDVRTRKSSVKTEESDDWKAIMDRDDGSGTALKTLRKVTEKGWGRQSISDLLPQNDDYHDH